MTTPATPVPVNLHNRFTEHHFNGVCICSCPACTRKVGEGVLCTCADCPAEQCGAKKVPATLR